MKQKSEKGFYWPPAVTVDIVIFTIENNDLKTLLIRRSNEPFKNNWALPGGFLHKDKENTGEAAHRILREKAVIKNVYIEQLYTFDSPSRDPRGHTLSVTYFALVPKQKIAMEISGATQEPFFHSTRYLPKLAFDHKEIIEYAIRRLRAKLEYTNAAFSLLPEYFPFSELQKTYEVILGRHLDKRNFKKKFMMLGLIKQTSKILRGAKQRPARLYRFVSRKPAELKKFF